MRSTKPKRGKHAYQCARKPEGCAGVSIVADDTEPAAVRGRNRFDAERIEVVWRT